MRKTSEEKERINLPMVCIHHQEGKDRAEQLREKVKQFIELQDDELFVSWMIMALDSYYLCTIDKIPCDQWFAVWAENQDELISVQCDRVEDGLAAILEYHMDNRERVDGD